MLTSEYNRKLCRSESQFKAWGDSRGGDDNCKIFVKDLSSSTTVDDLRKFFEPCGRVEGITINGPRAYIRFSKPREVTKAVLLNKSILQNKTISIREYFAYKQPTKLPLGKINTSPPTMIARNRSLSRTQTSTGKRSSSHRRRRSSRERDRPMRQEVEMDRNSLRNHFGDHAISFVDVDGVVPMPKLTPNISPLISLPSELELLLKLVIEQKTARKLSLSQIQDLIKYFETEKIVVQGLNGFNSSGTFPAPFPQIHHAAQPIQPTPYIPVSLPQPGSQVQHEQVGDDRPQYTTPQGDTIVRSAPTQKEPEEAYADESPRSVDSVQGDESPTSPIPPTKKLTDIAISLREAMRRR